jgi:hypothetical protein
MIDAKLAADTLSALKVARTIPGIVERVQPSNEMLEIQVFQFVEQLVRQRRVTVFQGGADGFLFELIGEPR